MVPPRPYVQSSNLDTYTCSSKWISGNTDAGGRGVGGVTSPDLEGEVGGV